MKFTNILFGTALLALSTLTSAAIIQNSGSSGSYDALIDFESVPLGVNEIITTQFSSEGLTIVSHAGNVYSNSCGYNSAGFGNYINSYGINCFTNSVFQDFSLLFDNDIESLTWLVGYAGGGIDYSTYLDGILVESLNNVTLTQFTFTTFTGLFDEIRITEVNNSAYMMVDNLQITYAQVSEPSILVLLGLGLAGLGFNARRKKSLVS